MREKEYAHVQNRAQGFTRNLTLSHPIIARFTTSNVLKFTDQATKLSFLRAREEPLRPYVGKAAALSRR